MKNILLVIFLLLCLSPTAKSQGIAYMETSYQQSQNKITSNSESIPKMKYRRGKTGMVVGGVMVAVGTVFLVYDISQQDPNSGTGLAGPELMLGGVFVFGYSGAIYLIDKWRGFHNRPKYRKILMATDSRGVGLAYNF